MSNCFSELFFAESTREAEILRLIMTTRKLNIDVTGWLDYFATEIRYKRYPLLYRREPGIGPKQYNPLHKAIANKLKIDTTYERELIDWMSIGITFISLEAGETLYSYLMHAKLPVGIFKPVYTTAKLAIVEVISLLNVRVSPAVVNNIF